MKHDVRGVRLFCIALACAAVFMQTGCKPRPAALDPARFFCDSSARDQDDMCIWINQRNPQQSTVIASDKKADAVFVYDLSGRTLQKLPSDRPGNIDIRQGVVWNATAFDLVVCNERGIGRVTAYAVDPLSGTLFRLDNGTLQAPAAYGCCLYHSPESKKVYVVTTSKSGRLEQYELHRSPTGRVSSTNVRSLMLTSCEAAVADDEQKVLFIACEKDGIWKIGAEPHDRSAPLMIDRIENNGLRADIEGITVYREQGGRGYLIVSSQGNSRFNVYERLPPHRFIGSFCVRGVRFTDGIDVTSEDCGGELSQGFFVCHNGLAKKQCPVVLVPWADIARAIGKASRH